MRLGVGSVRLFGYQHGISKAEWSRWGSKQKRRPNTSGFALQWNIGLRLKTTVPSMGMSSTPSQNVRWLSTKLSEIWTIEKYTSKYRIFVYNFSHLYKFSELNTSLDRNKYCLSFDVH